jgi:DNA polymerase V
MNSMLRPMSPVLAASEPMLVQYLENQVCAGFPSPAEDLGAQRIDLASLLGTEREDT